MTEGTKKMTIDLQPFMPNGDLERFGEEMADWMANNGDFAKENKLVCEALKGSVNDYQFIASTAEMTKQQAQAFVSLLAELWFNDFDFFSNASFYDLEAVEKLGPVVRVFFDSGPMDQIAALNKYGKDLQMDIDIHDVDFA
jgi:hypothetical protein